MCAIIMQSHNLKMSFQSKHEWFSAESTNEGPIS